MSETLQLKASTRTALKKKVRELRQQGEIPAVVYGRGRDTNSVQVNSREFEKIYTAAGTGTLIDLSIDNGAPVKVMVQDVTRHHLTDDVQHIDFYLVNMTELVTSTVQLHFIGEAPASKSLGGTLVKNKDHINIRCLPSALIKEMDVPTVSLVTFDDVIRVKDIQLPEGVTVLDQADDIIAFVAAPRSDEELADLNKTVTEDVSQVEGVVKATDTAAPAADGKKADAKKKG